MIQDRARREAEAAMVDLNVGRKTVKTGEILATGGNQEELAFSVESLSIPTGDASQTTYKMDIGVGNTQPTALIVSIDKFEINGISFPYNGRTVMLDEKTENKKVVPFMWTSEQLREAGIGEISSFRIMGRYGYDDDTSTSRFDVSFPLFAGEADDTDENATGFEPKKEEYPIFDSDFMEVIAYDFEVVPSYGYKAKIYVVTKDYSDNLQVRLDVETNITQQENSEQGKGRTEFNGYLAPNSIYRGMLFAPCIDFGPEKSEVAYLGVVTTVHLSSLRLQWLEEHIDGLNERDMRVVDLCHAYPDARPMIAVTEIIRPDAERDFP